MSATQVLLSRLLFAVILFFCQYAYSQDLWKAEQEFNRIAEKYNFRYKTLMQTRGVHWSEQPISAWSLSQALSEWYGTGKVAVLFYYHESDTLRAWLLDGTGIQCFVKQSLGEDQLWLIEKKLKDALKVSTQSFSRAPTTRGARVMAPVDDPEYKTGIIDSVSRLLLPVKISSRLPFYDYLIIVPTHNLGTIPFALLKPLDDEGYLIDYLAYSIAPNLEEVGNALVKFSNNAYMSGSGFGTRPHPYFESYEAGEGFQNPLIIGNPAFSNEGEYNFPQLPGAEKEVKRIGDSLQISKVFMHEEATIDMVRNKAPEADLLYFATHGVSSTTDPLDSSFLAFAPGDSSPGYWTAREIQFTHLSARLAVLSACQTGLGNAHNAGIIGLTRAFQIAGVDHVIMSLWNVNDEATADLMVAFITELQTNKDFIPAVALRNAILKTREKYPDPAHWASFVVFGIPY